MALVLDTGPILAALDAEDPHHDACAQLVLDAAEPLVVVAPTLVEVEYWIRKRLALAVWKSFVEDMAAGAYRLEHLTVGDLLRAEELGRWYADQDLGFVDCAVVAVCERLGETKVATLDRRHFGIIQPRHCDRLRLLPE
jgi:uncharacterized protein